MCISNRLPGDARSRGHTENHRREGTGSGQGSAVRGNGSLSYQHRDRQKPRVLSVRDPEHVRGAARGEREEGRLCG